MVKYTAEQIDSASEELQRNIEHLIETYSNLYGAEFSLYTTDDHGCREDVYPRIKYTLPDYLREAVAERTVSMRDLVPTVVSKTSKVKFKRSNK